MSKFKITPRLPVADSLPANIAEFGAGAALVKSQSPDRPVKPVRLNLDIDPALHQRLKEAAFYRSEKISVLVRQWITDGLEKD